MDSTKRFSNRVEDYRKFRPTYPHEIIALLERDMGLSCISFAYETLVYWY